MYVTIIAYWEPLEFQIHHAGGEPRRRVVAAPQSELDCLERDSEQLIDSHHYGLAARSSVVLVRQAAA